MAKSYKELARADARYDAVLRAATHERYLVLRSHRPLASRFSPEGLEGSDEARTEAEIEGVHDVRVWAKRTREVLRMLRACKTVSGTRAALRAIDLINDACAEVRDCDVMIQRLEAELAEVDPVEQRGIEWLIEDRRRRRREAFPHMLEAFEAMPDERLDALIYKVTRRRSRDG